MPAVDKLRETVAGERRREAGYQDMKNALAQSPWLNQDKETARQATTLHRIMAGKYKAQMWM